MELFNVKFVLLYTDALLYLLLFIVVAYVLYARRHAHLIAPWKRLATDSVAMGSVAILLAYAIIGLADSIHFRAKQESVPSDTVVVNDTETTQTETAQTPEPDKTIYSTEVKSLLDLWLQKLQDKDEKTYSAPLATHLHAKESIEQADGSVLRDFPRLKHGGAHLTDIHTKNTDIFKKVLLGVFIGLIWSLLLLIILTTRQWLKYRKNQSLNSLTWLNSISHILKSNHPESKTRWRAFWIIGTITLITSSVLWHLSNSYHVLGTDKIGQDVLYQALKSIRTGLLIGTLTTLVMLPFAIFMGIAAGYFRGWIDDVIQFIYTTLNSIPGVLLIAAAILMLSVYLDNNAEQFNSLLQRTDMRLLFLCIILGITSWTGLCRYLRAESLKLREMDYIAAARSQGVGHLTILGRHILPNVMHIVLITVALDFSGLVLAEAALAYVQIGVDPTTESWGNMINGARLEMAREPIVWWSLAAAFIFMFILVLAANLFADAVRDALDPKEVIDE